MCAKRFRNITAAAFSSLALSGLKVLQALTRRTTEPIQGDDVCTPILPPELAMTSSSSFKRLS